MKKIFLTLLAVVATLSASAQGIEIQKTTGSTTTTVASYTNTSTDTYKAVLKKTPTVAFDAAGHEYVEIGGLKWAKMNIGATTEASSAATCYGNYYQWGGVQKGYENNTVTTSTTINGTWKSSWKDGNTNKGYTSGYYPESSLTANLTPANDIAHLAWGGTWRMPTSQEFMNLADACTSTSGSYTLKHITSSNTSDFTGKGIFFLDATVISGYQVAGLVFCDGTNKVFFPAAGYISGTSLCYAGACGNYWSSYLSDANGAYNLDFTGDRVYPQGSDDRCRYYGFTVRPVSE